LVPIYAAGYGISRALAISDLLTSNKILSDAVFDPNGYIYCLGAGNGAELAAMVNHTSPNKPSATLNINDLADNTTMLKRFTTDRPDLRVELSVGDVLDENDPYLDECIKKATLITASFIMNELLATSKLGFVKLLKRLVKGMKSGALLLVLDSAGSFSNVGVSESSYMAYDLLDKVGAFEIAESDDSRWWRFPKKTCKSLKGMKLANMRYFLRIYRRR
jgi:25S rRNA (uracil2843-N3)-methyltransferase